MVLGTLSCLPKQQRKPSKVSLVGAPLNSFLFFLFVLRRRRKLVSQPAQNSPQQPDDDAFPPPPPPSPRCIPARSNHSPVQSACDHTHTHLHTPLEVNEPSTHADAQNYDSSLCTGSHSDLRVRV
ncbi:hypothetical protein LZ32DRAFT_599210 [Colletotrichum eremochloae]|nr:hypothetical protein LZ32DRAFT_599210 [Colletotrichum eremochloae]